MKSSIHKYFQVGTITWMSYPGTPQHEVIEKIAADDYFDAVEVCLCPDDQSRQRCKNLLKQSHLKVCYGAQPRLLGPKLNPNDLDEEGRKAAEATLFQAIDEAEYLGAKSIAFLAGKYSEDTKELAYAQLVKTTKNVCSYAADRNMFVELEVFDFDIDKAVLIGPAPLAVRFAADIRANHQNFGLLVDLSHFPLTYETPRFIIQALRPYITHLHFGNAVVNKEFPAYGDKHPRFGIEGGANDTPELYEYLQVLREEGFFRLHDPLVLSMEVTPSADERADIILANTKRVLNRAWAMLED